MKYPAHVYAYTASRRHKTFPSPCIACETMEPNQVVFILQKNRGCSIVFPFFAFFSCKASPEMSCQSLAKTLYLLQDMPFDESCKNFEIHLEGK